MLHYIQCSLICYLKKQLNNSKWAKHKELSQIQGLLTNTWGPLWSYYLQFGKIVAPVASVEEKDTETVRNYAILWLLLCSSVAKNLAPNLCLIEITPLFSSSFFFFFSFLRWSCNRCYLWNYRFTGMGKPTLITILQEQTCWSNPQC